MTAMQKDFREDAPSPREPQDQINKELDAPASPQRRQGSSPGWMTRLVQMGVGEFVLRAGTNLLSILAIGIAAWLVQMFYRQTPNFNPANAAQESGPLPTSVVDIQSIPAMDDPGFVSISRGAQLHTN